MSLTHGKTRKNGQKIKKGMSLAHFSKIIKCGINKLCTENTRKINIRYIIKNITLIKDGIKITCSIKT